MRPEVSAKIGLPAALDMFPEEMLDRSPFKASLDIAIVGVSVAGTRVGVFAILRTASRSSSIAELGLRPGPHPQIVNDIKQALVSLVDERGIVGAIVLDYAQGLRDELLGSRACTTGCPSRPCAASWRSGGCTEAGRRSQARQGRSCAH